jgi:hypothetical protein
MKLQERIGIGLDIIENNGVNNLRLRYGYPI